MYDLAEFLQIYEDYRPRLVSYLSRLAGESEAEDLAQEVFLKASQALPEFRGHAKLSTWLYRIATHAACDQRRSPAFRHETELPLVDDPFDALQVSACGCGRFQDPPARAIEQQYVRGELSACIQNTLRQLPESYRVVVVLSDLEELPNQEIAAILGLSLETVKMRLHRGRAKLRELFLDRCEYYWVSELGWPAGP